MTRQPGTGDAYRPGECQWQDPWPDRSPDPPSTCPKITHFTVEIKRRTISNGVLGNISATHKKGRLSRAAFLVFILVLARTRCEQFLTVNILNMQTERQNLESLSSQNISYFENQNRRSTRVHQTLSRTGRVNNMAAFCACCGAQITLKGGPCPRCGSPQHGMSQREPSPSVNSPSDPKRKNASH